MQPHREAWPLVVLPLLLLPLMPLLMPLPLPRPLLPGKGHGEPMRVNQGDERRHRIALDTMLLVVVGCENLLFL